MTDLEMTKLCAEAMKLDHCVSESHGYGGGPYVCLLGSHSGDGPAGDVYDPLYDDAQAMALLTQMRLGAMPMWLAINDGRFVGWHVSKEEVYAEDMDLRRAIVECVAARLHAER